MAINIPQILPPFPQQQQQGQAPYPINQQGGFPPYPMSQQQPPYQINQPGNNLQAPAYPLSNFNMNGQPLPPLPPIPYQNQQYNAPLPRPQYNVPQQMCLREEWIYFPDGTRYFGGVLIDQRGAKVPHGNGEIWFTTHYHYIGQFQWGKRHGMGKDTYPNGDTYVGEYVNDRFHGRGVSVRGDKRRRYTGDFVNGIEHGQGSVWTVDEMGLEKTYSGGMSEGVRHGQGCLVLKYAKGYTVTFTGIWRNDVLHGPGAQEDSIRTLQGTFYNGFLEGFGYEIERATSVRKPVEFFHGNIVRYLCY